MILYDCEIVPIMINCLHYNISGGQSVGLLAVFVCSYGKTGVDRILCGL